VSQGRGLRPWVAPPANRRAGTARQPGFPKFHPYRGPPPAVVSFVKYKLPPWAPSPPYNEKQEYPSGHTTRGTTQREWTQVAGYASTFLIGRLIATPSAKASRGPHMADASTTMTKIALPTVVPPQAKILPSVDTAFTTQSMAFSKP